MAEEVLVCLVTCSCESQFASQFEWGDPDPSGDIYPVPTQRCGICPPGHGGIRSIRVLFGDGAKDVGVDVPNALDAYQEFTATTATFKDTVKANVTCPKCEHPFTDARLEFLGHATYTILGLVGEVGELAEKLKKHIRHGRDLRDLQGDDGVRKEFGDVAWYLAASTRMFSFKLSDVVATNVSKIQSRLTRGVLHGEGDNR